MKKIKKHARALVQKYFGYDLSAIRIKIGDDFYAQKKLLAKNSTPVIFDVGANVGQTTLKYKKLFQKAEIYGFEPFKKVFEKYSETFKNDRHVHPENIALSNKAGEAEFFVNKLHYTNSLLPNNKQYSDAISGCEPVTTSRVKTETLDSYCLKNKIDRINILKMDVQGGELLVLEGSKKMLLGGKIDMIYTEVEFVPIYLNQPLMKDLEHFLKGYGFKLLKTYNVEQENGKKNSGDALFIHS